jgi:hypothetical protein
VFKGLGNLASMLKQAQQIGGQLQGLSETLKTKRTTGSAGAGMVEIEVNGLSEVLRCKIDPALLKDGDHELLEDLVAAAVNQAMTKARQLHAEALQGLTGSLNLPGLDEAMAKMAGDGAGDSPSDDSKTIV